MLDDNLTGNVLPLLRVSKDDQREVPASALRILSMLSHEVCEFGPAGHWTGQTHSTEGWPTFLCQTTLGFRTAKHVSCFLASPASVLQNERSIEQLSSAFRSSL